MKKYLIRSVKYLIAFCVLYVAFMAFVHYTEHAPITFAQRWQLMFESGWNGWSMVVGIILLATTYPFFGFAKRSFEGNIVADREHNKLLVMMVCGRTVCWHGRWNPSKIGQTEADSVNRVARIYLTYNKKTGEWEKSEIVEMTDHIYSLFLDGDKPTVSSMFIGSGKICQSSRIKVGKYYRLYCSMWTRDGGNRVLYSDDFGG